MSARSAPQLAELLGLLRNARDPWSRLRLVAQGARALSRLTPAQRGDLLRTLGLEGAEELAELAAGGDPKVAQTLEGVLRSLESDPRRVEQIARDIADPRTRRGTLAGLAAHVMEVVTAPPPAPSAGVVVPPAPPAATGRPAKAKGKPAQPAGGAARAASGAATQRATPAAAPSPAPPPPASPAPPRQTPAPPPRDAAFAAAGAAAPAAGAAAHGAGVAAPAPAPATVPAAPAPAAAPARPAATPPGPAASPSPPPWTATPRAPKPAPAGAGAAIAPPSRVAAESAPALPPTVPGASQPAPDLPAVAEATGALARLRSLRRALGARGAVSTESLHDLLDHGLASDWARRRALAAAFASGVPAGLDDALALVARLSAPSARRWVLGDLAASRAWPEGEWERLLAAADSPAARRRLASLRGRPALAPAPTGA